jgi:hypothetical protein
MLPGSTSLICVPSILRPCGQTINGGIIILGSHNNDHAAATADEHNHSLEGATTPDVVGAEAVEEETTMIDRYLSYFCLTLLVWFHLIHHRPVHTHSSKSSAI